MTTGTLFGLGKLKEEAFLNGMHAKYLMDKYLGTEVGISLPRINNAEGGFQTKYQLDDKTFVQFILAVITSYSIHYTKLYEQNIFSVF